jgi:hypothetical protein
LCLGDPCDDGDDCTIDSCDSANGGCTNEVIVCGNGRDCIGGICIDPCTSVECNDDDACTIDSCSDGECEFDRIKCEPGFKCQEGECVRQGPTEPCRPGHGPRGCPDDLTCDRATGECVDLCADVICDAGFICDHETGDCIEE